MTITSIGPGNRMSLGYVLLGEDRMSFNYISSQDDKMSLDDTPNIEARMSLDNFSQQDDYHLGTFSCKQAASLLSNQSPRTWLLHSSPNENHVISYIKGGGVFHLICPEIDSVERLLSDLSLDLRNNILKKPIGSSPLLIVNEDQEFIEEALKFFEKGSWLIRRLPSNDISLIFKDSKNEIQERIYDENVRETNLLSALSSLHLLPKNHISTKYDQQVILNLGSELTATALKVKALKKMLPTTIIDLKGSTPDFSPLITLTHASRIYIIGESDATHLQSISSSISHSIKTLVEGITSWAPNLQSFSFRPIKVSLIVSKAGTNGFGANLSKELHASNIYATVIAPTGNIEGYQWNPFKPEDYKKVIDGKHKAPGSVVEIKTETTITPKHIPKE